MRIGSVVLASTLAVGLIHCVGDEPGVAAGGDQDAATNGDDGGPSGDGSIANDGGNDGSTSTGDGGVDAGPYDSCVGATNCPNQIASAGTLELWLRGGVGETCTSHRLAKWNDQSGKGRDATPGTFGDGGAALAPQCDVDSMNGVPVETFTAPGSGTNGELVDETLDVDLAFLGGAAAYSIFVVVERTSDVIGGFLATDFQQPPKLLKCNGVAADAEYNFLFGYENTLDYTNVLGYSEGCAGQSEVADEYTASTPELDELFFSTAVGHSIYQNGSMQTSGGSGNDLGPLQDTPGHGVIGRLSNDSTDSRLHGKIAEIVIFSTLLGTAERQNIENHLKKQWNLTF